MKSPMLFSFHINVNGLTPLVFSSLQIFKQSFSKILEKPSLLIPKCLAIQW